MIPAFYFTQGFLLAVASSFISRARVRGYSSRSVHKGTGKLSMLGPSEVMLSLNTPRAVQLVPAWAMCRTGSFCAHHAHSMLITECLTGSGNTMWPVACRVREKKLQYLSMRSRDSSSFEVYGDGHTSSFQSQPR